LGTYHLGWRALYTSAEASSSWPAWQVHHVGQKPRKLEAAEQVQERFLAAHLRCLDCSSLIADIGGGYKLLLLVRAVSLRVRGPCPDAICHEL
jgi:hypothetical protein